ncbi:MAG: biopolymer transporter ExbD [Prevotella sp.]|nr:biopolymer transporter ExbD [Prevotella sp.]
MSIIQRKRRRLPDLNTAALPDLIFTVLFFFMIVTHMRNVPVKVTTKVPQGTQLAKLVKNSSTIYVFVGKAVPGIKTSSTDSVVVQVNDKIVAIPEMADYLAAEREKMSPEEQEQLTVSVKIDRDVPMGVVTDVKMALRKAGTLKVHYAASKRKEKGQE